MVFRIFILKEGKKGEKKKKEWWGKMEDGESKQIYKSMIH